MKKYILQTKRPKAFHCLLNFIKLILRIIFKLCYRLEVSGREKISSDGRLIVCSNHISYLDPAVIEACYPGIIFFMAKEEAFKTRLLRFFFKYFNTFPVSRNKYDSNAIRYSLEVLADNEVLGMFPEGTRSPEGVIRQGHKGVGLIAVKSGSNILPVAVSGTNKIIRKPHKRLFFPKVRLIFGDMIDTGSIIEQYGSREAVEIMVSKTMDSIASLYKKINY